MQIENILVLTANGEPLHDPDVEELCRVYALMRRELNPWPGDVKGEDDA
jgi:hypothetical protein